ncbi:DUF3718 domain-containing protein [Alteromonas sp. H39]|uniref:DUF3718 domain-containing protein n=1 Tax=Alteromonas sp. H39 TaxID=3389876 RepID=UPI0039DF7CCD
MKTKLIILAGVVAGTVMGSSQAFAMDSYLEQTLVSFCESTMNNDRLQLDRDIRKHRFDHKTVATKVMCNGQTIMAFAKQYNAERTFAAFENRMPASLRPVTEIKDITVASADEQKWYVTVDTGH